MVIYTYLYIYMNIQTQIKYGEKTDLLTLLKTKQGYFSIVVLVNTLKHYTES